MVDWNERAKRARIRAVAEAPLELLEYLSWLRTGSGRSTDDYLFEKPNVRFEPRPGDLLVAEPALSVVAEGRGACLVSARSAQRIPLPALGAEEIQRLLPLFDGRRTLAELQQLAGHRATLDGLLREAFGKVLFAPLALHELEQRVSGVEIARFPGSPYEIARAYWANMAAVRERARALDSWLGDDQRFVDELCDLHVVALMGEDLTSFYRPRSPIAERRVAPGQLMHTRPELLETPGGTLFLSGPRVNASPIGGERYHELLERSLEQRTEGPARPAHVSTARAQADELDLGRVVRARAEHDAAAGDWFCPPRPLTLGHFGLLRLALAQGLAAASVGDTARAVHEAARFHRAFVRLHPFHCANQCLAMSLANAVLHRALGRGMPHLMLDHLAFRLSEARYASAFGRAVAAYAEPAPSVAARYLTLAARRSAAFRLLDALSRAPSASHVASLVAQDEAGARALLLGDEALG